MGLGNGLRNKFAEALARNDKQLARIYLSTAYAILALVVLAVYLLFIVIEPYLDWRKILNAPGELGNELNLLVVFVFTFFSFQFVLGLISTVLIADQKPSLRDLFDALGSLLSLGAIFVLAKTAQGSLLYLGICMSVVPVLVLISASVYFFSGSYKDISPSLGCIRFDYARDLMGLGFRFFLIKLSGIILFSVNSLLITHLFGPAEVTPFNVAMKYFNLVSMLFAIILTPMWSAYTEAYAKQELEWIRKVTRKLVKIWLIFALSVTMMILLSDSVYKMWVGRDIKVPTLLSIVAGVYVLLLNWDGIFVILINGVGKIRLQMYSSFLAAIINIPLAIFFAKYWNLGIASMIIATCVSISIPTIVDMIQFKKIITGRAVGIWGR